MPDPGGPTTNTSHPVILGETFTEARPSQSYCSLRYDFKPASAGRFRPGSLELQPSQSKVLWGTVMQWSKGCGLQLHRAGPDGTSMHARCRS